MTKPPKDSPELDEARLRQQAIGARLRQIFDDVVNEPVPDDFLEILRRAEAPGADAGATAVQTPPGDAGGVAGDRAEGE